MYTTTTYFTEYDRLQEEQNAEIRRSRPFQHAIRLMKADVTFWLILAIMQCIDVIMGPVTGDLSLLLMIFPAVWNFIYVKLKVDKIKVLMTYPTGMEEYWKHHVKRHIREVLINIFCPALIPVGFVLSVFGGFDFAELIESIFSCGK